MNEATHLYQNSRKRHCELALLTWPDGWRSGIPRVSTEAELKGNNIIEQGRYIPGMTAHFPLRSSQPTNSILVKT